MFAKSLDFLKGKGCDDNPDDNDDDSNLDNKSTDPDEEGIPF